MSGLQSLYGEQILVHEMPLLGNDMLLMSACWKVNISLRCHYQALLSILHCRTCTHVAILNQLSLLSSLESFKGTFIRDLLGEFLTFDDYSENNLALKSYALKSAITVFKFYGRISSSHVIMKNSQTKSRSCLNVWDILLYHCRKLYVWIDWCQQEGSRIVWSWRRIQQMVIIIKKW